MICDQLDHQRTPLIVAAVDYVFALYKNASGYKNIHPENLGGNFDEATEKELFNAAKNLFQPSHPEENSNEAFEGLLTEGRATDKPKEVVLSAMEGRVAELLVKQDAQLWGHYDREKHEVMTDSMHSIHNTSLTNLAAIKTIQTGGKVKLADEEHMRANTEMTAIYHYAQTW